MNIEQAQKIIADLGARKNKNIHDYQQCTTQEERQALALIRAYEAYLDPYTILPFKPMSAAWSLVMEAHHYSKDKYQFSQSEWGNDLPYYYWAVHLCETKGRNAFWDIIWTLSQTKEERGEVFEKYIRENYYKWCFSCQGRTFIKKHYEADIGSVRFRVDGGEEQLFSNGYGDGEFEIIFGNHTVIDEQHCIKITAEKNIEFADYDCGKFYPMITLPAGKYIISRGWNGEIYVQCYVKE